MDVVFARLWDLCKDTGNKLVDVECFSMGMGVEGVFIRAIGFIEQSFRAGSPVDTGETDGATKQIGGHSHEPIGVLGPYRNGAVHGKSAAAECVQNLDPLVAQKRFVFEQVNNFVAEELLGSRGIDVGNGNPLSLVIPNPSRG